MTVIDYCDNHNCDFNTDSACNHPGPLQIDQNGSCISAVYDQADATPGPAADPFAKIPGKEEWFKRV